MTKEEFWQKQDKDIDEMSHETLKIWTKKLTRISYEWSDKYFQSRREIEDLKIKLSKLK